jgi:hypothetical protein
VTSTIFPHLSHERSAEFRLALLVVTATLVLLGYFRLTGPLVAVASAAVPLLFGLYLFEARTDDRAFLSTFAAAGGAGAVLGAIWALLTGHFITQTLLLNTIPPGAPVWRIVVAAVLFPLVAQLLMLIGPLIILLSRPSRDVLDGFDVGVATALGFAFASTLVYLLPEMQAGVFAVAAGTPFALRAVLRGLIVPLIGAGTTGLVTASFWLHRERRSAGWTGGWITSRSVCLAIAAVVQVGLGLVNIEVVNATTAILIYLGVALALLFWVRVALHTMLLSEAGEERAGPGAGPATPKPTLGLGDQPTR